MKKTFLTACAFLCACLSPLPIQAADYVWDNQAGNGIWNNPVNWGLQGNSGYNVAPTASDGAIFLKNFSPNGTVRLERRRLCAIPPPGFFARAANHHH